MKSDVAEAQPAITIPVLIIGYGNSLRSDDGLGWHMAQELLRIVDSARVEIISCGQLTPDLAQPISRAGTVLFIDAARDGCLGELRCERVIPASKPAAFTHQLSPSALLALARDLYGASPEAHLFAIRGQWFDYGESLSPAVSDHLPMLLARIREFIAQCEK